MVIRIVLEVVDNGTPGYYNTSYFALYAQELKRSSQLYVSVPERQVVHADLTVVYLPAV